MTGSQLFRVLMLCAMFPAGAQAAEPEPPTDALPEPFTLEHALALAEEMTPSLQLQQSDLMAAEAGLREAEAMTGFNTYLEAQARWVEPPAIASDQNSEDHRLGLVANKILYDFGRSRAAEAAAGHRITASQLRFTDARQRQRILIMQRYFDVVLADMQFYRCNEEMAVVYIALDKVKDRRELGQASDLDVLESEADYQRIRHLRYKSENEQRRSRALLANALNRPGRLPSTVAAPEFKDRQRKLAEAAQYQQAAQEHNVMLRALRSQVAAAEQSLEQARASDNPRLKGQVETYAYERELGSNDKWRAGVTLEVPLWTGGVADAGRARAQAELYASRARLSELEVSIKQAVLDTWLELDALRIRLEEMEAVADYRELYLDRSRALYEMEVKADLGDAMVKVSEAQRNLKQIQFEISLGWETLAALVGQDLNLIKASEPPSEMP